MRNQLPDFLALQRHELLVAIVFVELWAKVDGVDSRIIALNNEVVFSSEELGHIS